MTEEKRQKRTVRHASFKYTDENGHHQVAFRGAEVSLTTAEIERGEKFHAFFTKADGAEAENPGELDELNDNSTGEEFVAWIKNASVKDVEKALEKNDGLAEDILEAEAQAAKDQDRDVRVGVEKAVEAAVSHRSQ